MDLWLIERPDTDRGHDEAFGFVIAADDEMDARMAAASRCGDEGDFTWMDDRLSYANRIGRTIETYPHVTVLLRDFNAG